MINQTTDFSSTTMAEPNDLNGIATDAYPSDTIMINQTMDFFDAALMKPHDVEDIAMDAYRSAFHSSPATTVLGLVFCSIVLALAVRVSHKYTVGEREELAEAERHRAEEEKAKQREIETYRSMIAKILESYAIHLTNITSRSSFSLSNHNEKDIVLFDDSRHCTIDIPQGNEDEEIQVNAVSAKNNTSEEIVQDIEAAASTGVGNEVIIDSMLPTSTDAACTVIRPTPTTTRETDDRIRDESKSSRSSSSSSSMSSSRNTFTRTNLREAVNDDPCAICLEPFRPGDDIVYCSNNVNGGRPHIFHQECTYDYIVNHREGMQAPCPCCRTLLIPLEGQRVRQSENPSASALTMPVAQESETSGHEEEERYESDHQEDERNEEDAETEESRDSSHDDIKSDASGDGTEDTDSDAGSDAGDDTSSGNRIEEQEQEEEA